MTCIGVSQATALRVEDGIEAGHKHVGWDANEQHLVDPRQYLPRRRGVRGLSGELQHATGGRHNQGCGHPLARSIPHHKPQPTLREEVEVVEVSAYLPGWLVERRDTPTLQCGH